MGAPGSDWRLGFFNPVATPSSYNLDMVEGVDYPALSEAVFNAAYFTPEGTVREQDIDDLNGNVYRCIVAEKQSVSSVTIARDA